MPRGRPRLTPADQDTQKKRDYQRTYQQARKDTISKLSEDIKKCQEDLKKMKAKRQELRDMAKKKIDEKLVNKDFDPEEYAKKGMGYVKTLMKK